MSRNRFENDGAGGDVEDNGDDWYLERRVVMISSCSSDLRMEDGSGETVLLAVLSMASVRESVVIVSTE